MLTHQSPPLQDKDDCGGTNKNSDENKLALEETDHNVAHLALTQLEVEPSVVSEDLLELPLEDLESDSSESVKECASWELSADQHSDEALEQLIKDLAENPESEELKVYTGIAYQRTGDFEASKKILGEAIENDPKNLTARRYYAGALMNLGEWSEGLLELEIARDDLTPLQADFCKDISRLWTGQDIVGKHIVIVSNGQQTDQILFSRYVDKLRKLRPQRIGFVSDSEMVFLLRSLAEINRVDDKVFEPFDYFIPVESLPLRLGADPSQIPNPPYLHCNRRKVEAKKAEIMESKPLLGICWRNTQPEGIDEEDISYRQNVGSLDLEPLEWHLKELAMDYDIVAFQEDLRLDELKVLNNCGCLIVDQEEFKDMMGIAEWISCLDSLITVDSPIAHLAGSLGVDAHILLPNVPDWKWSIDNEVSRWYPKLKIHQKQTEGCWNDCLSELMDDLRISETMQKAS